MLEIVKEVNSEDIMNFIDPIRAKECFAVCLRLNYDFEFVIC